MEIGTTKKTLLGCWDGQGEGSCNVNQLIRLIKTFRISNSLEDGWVGR